MRIEIDVAMHYRLAAPDTVFLALEAARTDGQSVVDESLLLGDAALYRIDGDAGVGQRIWANVPQKDMHLRYRAEVEITRQVRALEGMRAADRHEIPAEAAPYLRPSRYCQSDRFVSFAASRFGSMRGGAKIAAMRDWIQREMAYVPGSSNADTTVLETFAARQGVCRDYAHLLCTFARAAGIPARAAAVYGPNVTPSDFHAVTEVWLDEAWHLVDPTYMGYPDDLTMIAVGRDAYDIAFMDSQVPAEMISQSVKVTRK